MSKNENFDYIRTIKPRSAGHKVISKDNFLNGTVSQVEYTEGGAQLKIWLIITPKHKGHADNESNLIQQLQMASNRERDNVGWLDKVFNMSGLIALILVASAVYLTIHNIDGNIPEHLKASVLTIVGFYFGGLVRNSKKHQTDA